VKHAFKELPTKLLPVIHAGILAGALALPAMAHASVIEFSVSGVVAMGVDELGLFTSWGESIIGKPYTMKFSLDTATLTEYSNGYLHGASNANTSVPVNFQGEVIMGARSFTWSLNSGAIAELILTLGGDAYMSGNGQHGDNTYIFSTIGVYPDRPEPYFTRLDFDQRIEFKDFVDPWLYSSEFQMTYTAPRYPDDNGAYVGHTNFTGTGTYALWEVRAVPEPAPMGMLLAGVALLAGARRMRHVRPT
jgi:hypothetical protein